MDFLSLIHYESNVNANMYYGNLMSSLPNNKNV